MSADFKHDVAFSFLSIDEQIAIDLNEHLKPELDTFLYTEHGKEMLGPGGYDKYGRVFRYEARTVVVIYRDGWSERGYTAIEGGAIEQRVQAKGLDFLFVVVAPTPTRPAFPPYIRPAYVYCELPKFSIEAAADCIRDHARRAGTQPKVLTAAEIANAQRADEARAERLDRFRRTRARDAARVEFPKIYTELQRIVADAPDSFGAPTFDEHRRVITLGMKGETYPQLSIALNSASSGGTRDEELRVIIFPNEPLLYKHHPDSSLYRAGYQMAIEGDSDNDPPGWRLRHSDGRLMSSGALAEREVTALLKARARRPNPRPDDAEPPYRPSTRWS